MTWPKTSSRSVSSIVMTLSIARVYCHLFALFSLRYCLTKENDQRWLWCRHQSSPYRKRNKVPIVYYRVHCGFWTLIAIAMNDMRISAGLRQRGGPDDLTLTAFWLFWDPESIVCWRQVNSVWRASLNTARSADCLLSTRLLVRLLARRGNSRSREIDTLVSLLTVLDTPTVGCRPAAVAQAKLMQIWGDESNRIVSARMES